MHELERLHALLLKALARARATVLHTSCRYARCIIARLLRRSYARRLWYRRQRHVLALQSSGVMGVSLAVATLTP